MSPVSMSAVIMLLVARSRTAVVKAGYRGWSTRLGGKWLGIMVMALRVAVRRVRAYAVCSSTLTGVNLAQLVIGDGRHKH